MEIALHTCSYSFSEINNSFEHEINSVFNDFLSSSIMIDLFRLQSFDLLVLTSSEDCRPVFTVNACK